VEAEVGAEEEERVVKVHLVERDHQVVNVAVSKVVERLLLGNTTPGEGAIVKYRVVFGEVEEHGREDGEGQERMRCWICLHTRDARGESK
jgi:hypothetical protein